jgi:3-isopropylmalate/(R)-2-methylmalate dehydratase small subunit
MEQFSQLTSVAAPLPHDDIDTDVIYPARFLLITARTGLERYGFHDWRFNHDGTRKPGFPLDQDLWRGASILVTGSNFGCGSSREQAPWALFDMGLRCVIAPSFGEIFESNCFKNGILAITLPDADHAALMGDARAGRVMTIDLVSQAITRTDAATIAFTVEPGRRDALINGWDEIDRILSQHRADIDRWEADQRQSQPWLWQMQPDAG